MSDHETETPEVPEHDASDAHDEPGAEHGHDHEEHPPAKRAASWAWVVVVVIVVIVVAGVLFVMSAQAPTPTSDARRLDLPISQEKNTKETSGATIPSADNSSKATSVPDVTGMKRDAAVALLTNAGFKVVAVTSPDAAVPADEISAQEPKAGAGALTGAEVALLVSSGPAKTGDVQVPDLQGQTLQQAQQLLQSLGLKSVAVQEHGDATKASDTVSTQVPNTAVAVDKGATVIVVVVPGQ